ncbi:MAG: DMT family transporter [Gammaproteobacteria bacterium]
MRHKPIVPSLVVAGSGALWGLFWVPMRALETRGLEGGWGAVALLVTASVIILPLAIWRARRIVAGGWPLIAAGTLLGAGMVAYADALVATEVVRVLLLFYLTPLWSTVALRIMYGERVTPARAGAVVLGVLGLIVILDITAPSTMRHNAGDALALASGVLWALGSIVTYKHARVHSLDLLCVFLIAGAVCTLVIAALPIFDNATAPSASAMTLGTVTVVVMGIAVTVPTMYAVLWGSKILEPARVGILLMAEVVVGVGSAALFSGEPFGARELLGTVLIVGAAIVDVTQSGDTGSRKQPLRSRGDS